MGIIQNMETGERVLLRARHIFGRDAARSDTVLTDPEVSNLHAEMCWRGNQWFAVDHSRNGSLLCGRRLTIGQPMALELGHNLRFGPNAQSDWKLVDLSEPRSTLVPLDQGAEPIVLERHNLLPDTYAPELSLFEIQPGQWQLEGHGEANTLAHGDTFGLNGRRYRLFVPGQTNETQTSGQRNRSPLLSFRVSLNEEHTWLQVRGGRAQADLGERSHHYTLLTLARLRLADARSGLDPIAQGWVPADKLARMLGMVPTHLNIQIFRARDQLLNALPTIDTLSNVVERRRGELRLGPLNFEIYRGAQFEGQWLLQTGASV